jgi:hypothetical protein
MTPEAAMAADFLLLVLAHHLAVVGARFRG